MYEGTLKIEYQTTALSEYTLSVSPDHQQIQAVKNPRRIETQFVSLQLHLWQRGETEWLLAFKQPERHLHKNKRTRADGAHLRFPEIEQWWGDAAL